MTQRGNRRELLADAAIEVLAREGGRGLTHRAVDREAGVPEGTAKNYHPTRSALFRAIARQMSERHVASLRELAEHAPAELTPDDVAALYAAMLRRMTTSARAHFLALFELHLEAVRDAEVRAALGEIARANADTAVRLHGAVGRRMSRRGAGLLDAGLLGAALSVLSLPPEVVADSGFDDPEVLARALLSLGSVEDDPVVGVLRGHAS
ncbi:TetR/AcrR family transcriptional regulator [Saccharopolyspora cebuensis]|uniref:TetR/AcrR family transcriptional regulator n=1 Tax=Saccharopolyspora cebuensis TaxID=418759 RepID=A0ABV4CF63_9PSEU